MGKLERHVQEKLVEWAADGLITAEQAEAIRARESRERPGLPWGILIFAGFGAVVLGLGIILLFAYNWEKMHKFAKLGVVFGAMAAAHGGGVYLRRRGAAHGFAESAHLLGTMMFGAGIWLVAQIYHISAHYPNAFFVWSAGALLLAWAMPSSGQGLLATVLLVIWACTEAASFSSHLAAAPVLVLVGTGWLAWRLRSQVLLAAASISFSISAATGFSYNAESGFLVLLALPALFASLAWLTTSHPDFPTAPKILQITGSILYFPLLFILTFHDAAEELLDYGSWRWQDVQASDWLWTAILPATALALAGFALYRAAVQGTAKSPDFRGRVAAPALLLLVFFASWLPLRFKNCLFTDDGAGVVVAAFATGIFLYHTLANLWIGCRDARLGLVVGGSLLMAAWVFARYVDLFDSLLARGVMFLVMGAALFAVAILYHRQKKKARPAVARPVAAGRAASSGKEEA